MIKKLGFKVDIPANTLVEKVNESKITLHVLFKTFDDSYLDLYTTEEKELAKVQEGTYWQDITFTLKELFSI